MINTRLLWFISIIAIFMQTIGFTQNKKKNVKVSSKSVKDFCEMVFVKNGTFRMGSNEGTKAETPVHGVDISDFYIGKYEVTQKQWQDIMGYNPSHFVGLNRPVENVTDTEIYKFFDKLEEKTGIRYSLPTEAQWEFACRGGRKGKGYKYSGSDSIDEVGWYRDNANKKTHDIGKKKPNELGLYDMTGNVQEYCWDSFGGRYAAPPQKDPTGPTDGDGNVIRGGSYKSKFKDCRSTWRDCRDSRLKFIDVGFRVARRVK